MRRVVHWVDNDPAQQLKVYKQYLMIFSSRPQISGRGAAAETSWLAI
jgi:hypothetical protein